MKFGGLETGTIVREALDECEFLLNVWLLRPLRDCGDGGGELGGDIGQREVCAGEAAKEFGFVGPVGQRRGGRRVRGLRRRRLSGNPDLWARETRVDRGRGSAQRSGV